jgi:putative membrane protein
MRIVITVFYIVLILIGVSFAALNASSVEVNLYIASLKMPISVLMIAVLGVGVIFGVFIFFGRYWRLKGELRSLKTQLKLTEKEIKNLRSIPLKDQH